MEWIRPLKGKTCLPIKQKCDGILDFLQKTEKFSNTHECKAKMMLSDELICAKERYISVYVCIFSATGISILSTVVIWFMTCDTVGFFWKRVVSGYTK